MAIFYRIIILLIIAMVPNSILAMELSVAEVYYTCSDPANSTSNSSFAANLETLLSRLLKDSTQLNYSNATSISLNTTSNNNNNNNSSNNNSAAVDAPLYGIFQCRGDLNRTDCPACVSAATSALKRRCPSRPEGRVMLDSCFLRYANSSSFYASTAPELGLYHASCNTQKNPDPEFQASVIEALENTSASAPNPLNRGFATAYNWGGVYSLAQCFGYLSPTDCQICLSNVQDMGRSCPNATGAQLHYQSCFLRYEPTLFFTTPALLDLPASPRPSFSPLPSPGYEASSKPPNKGLVAAGAVLAFFLVFLVGATLCTCKRRKAKRTHLPGCSDDGSFGSLQGLVVQFSYTELMEATRNFTAENKIGEGGFGPVYKGVLGDGREVAIKKLSSISHQGKQEFMNEASTITSVQHRNLIRLLGCCVDGLEKLLVYEYLPNNSLDKHLFVDHPKDPVLDWETRFKIILGIARGLAYLHHDSQIRIIHRDIKPSNILLADDLTPKIADFGLAKLIADDNNRVSTSRVVGTFGYMAPEYAMRGQLTDKADVFSFGLVALEVVSGRRNNDLHQPADKQHLLEWAWKVFKGGRHTELVDERMAGNFSGEEAIRIVHVALLCTQSLAVLRPTMTDVIQYLVGQSEILGTPTVPAFIDTSSAMPSLSPLSTSSYLSGYSISPMTGVSLASCSMSHTEGR